MKKLLFIVGTLAVLWSNVYAYQKFRAWGTQKPPLGTSLNGSPLSKGLIAQYVMNEGGGGTLHSIYQANNGTLVNSPTWGPGRFGPVLTFNGTTQRVLATINSGLSNSFTISAWVYPIQNLQIAQAAVCSEQTNYWIFLGNGSSLQNKWNFALFDGVHNPSATTPVASVLNKWTHLVAVRDTVQGKLFLYQDGILQASATDTTTSVPAYSNFLIGAQVNIANRFFPGSVDNVQVWNRALLYPEIQSMESQPFGVYSYPRIYMIEQQQTVATQRINVFYGAEIPASTSGGGTAMYPFIQ